MKSTKKHILTLALCAVLVLCGGCSKEIEYVRDMSEVAARGSFVFNMLNNRDKIADIEDTLAFNTYDEFCANSFSEVVLYQSGHTDENNKWVTEYYKAKNERYNADYFEENSLLVAFFECRYTVSKQLIRDVSMVGNQCSIEVIQYCTVSAATSDAAVYACFIETKGELSYDVEAEVSVDTYTFSTDTGVYCYYGDTVNDYIDADGDEVTAYYIPTRSAMEIFIADNPYLDDNGMISFVMKMKYDEEYFWEYSLLFLQLPGRYRGLVDWNGGSLKGLRFDSDHYEEKKIAERNEEELHHTAVAFIAVPKNIERDSFTYSFESFSEWEEGVSANNVQSEEITLVRTDNGGKDYVTFIQQGL